MNSPISKAQQESLKIISRYFGERIEETYQKKFAGQSDAMVLVMVRTLLGEYLGRQQTEIHMNRLHQLIDKNENE